MLLFLLRLKLKIQVRNSSGWQTRRSKGRTWRLSPLMLLDSNTMLPPSSNDKSHQYCGDSLASVSKGNLNLSLFSGTFHREILGPPAAEGREYLYIPQLCLRSAEFLGFSNFNVHLSHPGSLKMQILTQDFLSMDWAVEFLSGCQVILEMVIHSHPHFE